MADNKFLDQAGLSTLWSQIEKIFPRIRQEADVEYAAKASTFIPAKNELCVVVFNNKTVRMKVGNGVSVWSDLPYVDENVIKLYSTTGQNTDGTITQKGITDALDTKVGATMDSKTETLTFT